MNRIKSCSKWLIAFSVWMMMMMMMGQKTEEAAVGRPPESSREWVFPSGKFWLVFLTLAKLQSDYFVLLLFLVTQNRQRKCTRFTTFLLSHFHVERTRSNQCVIDNSGIVDHKLPKSHELSDDGQRRVTLPRRPSTRSLHTRCFSDCFKKP